MDHSLASLSETMSQVVWGHPRCVVESSDKMRSTEEGNGKPLQYSCLDNPMNSMKRQKDMTLKDKLPRPVGAQYATAEEQRKLQKE